MLHVFSNIRIGRIKGVNRPAIATLMPTSENQNTLVLDVGANVDSDTKKSISVCNNGSSLCTMALDLMNQ